MREDHVHPGYLVVFESMLPQEHELKRSGRPWLVIPVTIVLWLLLGTVTVLTVGWIVPVSMFLGLHVASVLQQIKLTLEHGGKIGKDPNRYFRSRTSLFLLRPLLMPLNISLHFEHHLNYCVPWYDLPRYQQALRKVIPEYLQGYVFNRDIWEQLSGHKDVEISSFILNPIIREESRSSFPTSASLVGLIDPD